MSPTDSSESGDLPQGKGSILKRTKHPVFINYLPLAKTPGVYIEDKI